MSKKKISYEKPDLHFEKCGHALNTQGGGSRGNTRKQRLLQERAQETGQH